MATTALNRRVFAALALASAAVFVRLGVWQLHRRDERLARNALIIARSAAPAVDVLTLSRDTNEIHYRHVRVAGTIDYDHELLYAARSYKGSPGVNFFTPVRIAGNDTAILVDRGWVYAADGSTVDQQRWREAAALFIGYVAAMPATGGSAYASRPNVIARLGYDAVAKALPYPVFPYYVIALGDSAAGPDHVARLAMPDLGQGPHLSYAVQWFFFALIAVVGAVFVWRRGNE